MELPSHETLQPPFGQLTVQVAPAVQSMELPLPESVTVQRVPAPSQLGSLPWPTVSWQSLPPEQVGSLLAPTLNVQVELLLQDGSLPSPQVSVQLPPPKMALEQPPSQAPWKLPPSSSSPQPEVVPEVPLVPDVPPVPPLVAPVAPLLEPLLLDVVLELPLQPTRVIARNEATKSDRTGPPRHERQTIAQSWAGNRRA